MQTQTRRLQKIALLATRHEAEFVSGVLDAADLPHAVVEVDAGLELRVDPDDVPKVRQLIDRLDVKQSAAASTTTRRAEGFGRRLVLGAVGLVLLLAGIAIAARIIPIPAMPPILLGALLAIPGLALLILAIARKPAI